MAGEEEEIRKAFNKMSTDEIMFETAENMHTIMSNIISKGMLPKEAMGVTDQQMDAYYALAYRLYNSGKFEKASWIFRLLVALNSTETKFAFGLAACLHMLKAYAEAAKIYTICTFLNASDPIPCFHASDCYIQMRDPTSALMSLELAVKRSEKKPEFQVMRDRALLTIKSLKQEIKERLEAGTLQVGGDKDKSPHDPWAF